MTIKPKEMTDFGWVPTSVRLPITHCYVIVSHGTFVLSTRLIKGWGRNADKLYWENYSSAGIDYFDHWMALPKAPRQSGETK